LSASTLRRLANGKDPARQTIVPVSLASRRSAMVWPAPHGAKNSGRAFRPVQALAAVR